MDSQANLVHGQEADIRVFANLLILQLVPTPSGQLPTASQFTTNMTGNFQNDLANIVAQMRAQGDTTLASQFQSFALTYHASNPAYNAQQVLSVYLAQKLSGSLATGITGAGTALGQIPAAAAKGAADAANTLDPFHGLNLGSWILRIGEILLGIVLVGVGIARITGAQNAISNIVKTKMPIPI